MSDKHEPDMTRNRYSSGPLFCKCGERLMPTVDKTGSYACPYDTRHETIKPVSDKHETPIDNVNHPSHYTRFSNGAEVIDITENLNFNRGNAVKYLARAGAKDPAKTIEDLRKAAWYVAREIERLKKEGK